MKPDAQGSIYQTKVSTIPSSNSAAPLTAGESDSQEAERCLPSWAGDETSQIVSTVDTLLAIDTKV